MTWEHERVEELLAAHVVHGLDPEDAELAERALEEHVPDCPRCRGSLEAYRAVAGDLALLAPPVDPPEVATARIERSVRGRPRRRWGHAGVGAAAALVAAAAGLTTWNVTLTDRLADAENRQAIMADAFSTLATRDVDAVPLEGQSRARVTVVHDPVEDEMYLIATDLPDVDGVYTVWLLSDERAWSPGALRPQRGVAMMPVHTEISRWDVIMLTVEPEPGRPSPAASPLMSATFDSG